MWFIATARPRTRASRGPGGGISIERRSSTSGPPWRSSTIASVNMRRHDSYRRQRRSLIRQPHLERGALPRSGRLCDLPPGGPDDVSGQGEAEPGPPWFGGDERLEDPIHDRGVEA